jgi:hypothetical protein
MRFVINLIAHHKVHFTSQIETIVTTREPKSWLSEQQAQKEV